MRETKNYLLSYLNSKTEIQHEIRVPLYQNTSLTIPRHAPHTNEIKTEIKMWRIFTTSARLY